MSAAAVVEQTGSVTIELAQAVCWDWPEPQSVTTPVEEVC